MHEHKNKNWKERKFEWLECVLRFEPTQLDYVYVC